jgi:CubicO group peptidase (beta-lactamase class C family)
MPDARDETEPAAARAGPAATVYRARRRCALGIVLAAGLLTTQPAAPREADSSGQWRTLGGERRDAAGMDAFLQDLVVRNRVAAMSVAVLHEGRIAYRRTIGVADTRQGTPADERTVFRAASLTKPVFAYLVMKLADEGLLDLDTPIHRYLEKPLPSYPAYSGLNGDARHERLTARLLLSHQSGLPNWRRVRPDGPIRIEFAPGDHFSYSGEGYCLLQLVVEQMTGRGLAELADEKVFAPLGMRDSSFLWEPRFDGRFAVDLASPLGALIATTRVRANAAASLVTNASDYAAFLAAVTGGVGLSARSRAALLEPRVALTSRSLFSAPGTDGGANRARKMAWTPGWGTFEDRNGRALFHVGMEEGCENFVEAFPARRLGVVFFSLTPNERSFSAELVDYALGPAFSPLEWLEYGAAPPAPRLAVALVAGLVAVAAGLSLALLAWSRHRRARDLASRDVLNAEDA